MRCLRAELYRTSPLPARYWGEVLRYSPWYLYAWSSSSPLLQQNEGKFSTEIHYWRFFENGNMFSVIIFNVYKFYLSIYSNFVIISTKLGNALFQASFIVRTLDPCSKAPIVFDVWHKFHIINVKFTLN